ncbi:MAG: galactokinase, partial [Verrucomicrobia bacterium]|nr:galactokinase [Verrucomicrobiota bacterium]
SSDDKCSIHAADVKETAEFRIGDVKASRNMPWSNYVKGVFAKLPKKGRFPHGFNGVFMGNLPLGSGLSSSAALEISAGLALARIYDLRIKPLDLALAAQAAEHDFAGVNCGLLDQISSLHGQKNQLVLTDFRSVKVRNISIGSRVCFLMCNTNVKHALVTSEYNERHARCKKATAAFARLLDHRVKALRDVSWYEWQALSSKLDDVTSRRAAHVIGENKRVLDGLRMLAKSDLAGFGQLMFESHESSRVNFENSCPELDFIVATARTVPGVLGARLSGGGFGGSAVILADPDRTTAIGKAISAAYAAEFGSACDVRKLLPSAGASLLQ